jgi:hypothetical protein
MKSKQNFKERIKTKFGIFLIKKGSNLMAKGLNMAQHPVRLSREERTVTEKRRVFREDMSAKEIMQLPYEERFIQKDVQATVTETLINKGTPEQEEFLFAAKNAISAAAAEFMKWTGEVNNPWKVGAHHTPFVSSDPPLKPVKHKVFSQKKSEEVIKQIKEMDFRKSFVSSKISYKVEVPNSKNFEKILTTEFKYYPEEKWLTHIDFKFVIKTTYREETKGEITTMTLFVGEKEILPEFIPSDIPELIIKNIKNINNGIL